MTHNFKTTAEILAEKFERLAARECISSAEKAAEQMGYKTTAGIILATIDGCLVWAKFSGKNVTKFLPVFPETSVKNKDKRAHPFNNEVGEYFSHENKLFYYDADKKNISHVAILYNSDIAEKKVQLQDEDFIPKSCALTKASSATRGKCFYAWLIKDYYGKTLFLPVFDQDYVYMLDKNGKELPKRDFSLTFLTIGQSVVRKGHLYPVEYGAARTTLLYT